MSDIDPVLASQIEEIVQGVVLDSLDGSPAGSMLYARLRRIIEARLRRASGGPWRHVQGWTIDVGPGSDASEVSVVIRVQVGRRVEAVRVTVSGP